METTPEQVVSTDQTPQQEPTIKTLSGFMEAAQAAAANLGIQDTSTVAVYAFYEFGKAYYVCQIAVGEQVMRAPLMHSPDAAVVAFVDSLNAAIENSNKENTDIEL